MSKIKDEHLDVARCASVVAGLPNGILFRDLAKLMGISNDRVSKLLTINRRLGVLNVCAKKRWVAIEHYNALCANLIEQTRIRKNINNNKRKIAREVFQQVIPKNRLHTPNSVWQLANFL
jgi:hypothetical protein